MIDVALSFIFGILLYKLFDYIRRLPRLPLSPKTQHILITGCDTGFGNLFAKRMDNRGFCVFAGCLTEEGVLSISETCSSHAKPFLLDVTEDDSVRMALGFVQKTVSDKGLWAVVNNAGISGPIGQVSWLTKSDYDPVFDVNFHGVRRVCEAFIPLLKKSRGRIVNTSSILGRFALAHVTPYSVAKYAVEAFSDALRRDLHHFGVTVHLIEPGFFKTNLLDWSKTVQSLRRTWDSVPHDIKMQYGMDYVDRALQQWEPRYENEVSSKLHIVVDAYEHATIAVRPRTRYVVGLDAKLAFVPLTLLPDWFGDKFNSKASVSPSAI